MTNKNYWVLASTMKRDIIDSIIFDPLGTISCTDKYLVGATDEIDAIVKFQESNAYKQFCEEHIGRCVYTYIKEEDEPCFHKVKSTTCEPDNKE